MRRTLVLLGVAAMLLASASPVLAQTTTTAPYPGTTSTTAPPTSQNAGSVSVGQSITVTSCGFLPGRVNVALNGQGGATETAEADGCVRSTITVVSTTQIRVEGFTFRPNSPAAGAVVHLARALLAQAADFCGTNTLTVSGTAAAGGSRTVNSTFSVSCAAAADGGLLPPTGAMILRWSLAGAALVAVGALLVLARRRKGGGAVAS